MPIVGYTTVKARLVEDNTGRATPMLVLAGPAGVIPPLLEYQRLFPVRSISWHKSLCHAVRLLLEYAAANSTAFTSPRELFQAFSVRLLTGTCGADGGDPSGLYWRRRRPRNVNALIDRLTKFCSWLAKNYGVPDLNPLRDATNAEQVIAAAAWAHRNNAAFLGHVESQAKAKQFFNQTPWAPRHIAAKVVGERKPRFPEASFLPLIFEGFILNRRVDDKLLRLDLRCALIALLQHGGGLRTSECFHLWVQDVEPDPLDPSIALVRIGDPEEGFIEWTNQSGKYIRSDRRDYLAYLGHAPRNKITGKQHAGWKRPTLDGKWFMQVYWSDPVYGQLFMRLWRIYLRVLIGIERLHPWAFVNFSHERGSPFTISKYVKAHKRAVERIGLIPEKPRGTTPHGHRHAYLYRLAEANVPEVVIKRVAHHHCMESQRVYTEPELAKVRAEINSAYQRIEGGGLSLGAITGRYAGLIES
jgi:hypothetical protein